MAASGGYRPLRPGDALTAKGVNQNIVGGSMRGVKLSGDVDKRQFRGGYSLDMPQRGGISPWSAYMRPAIVIATDDDTVDVKFYSEGQGAGTGSTFTIAKAYRMRLTIFPDATDYEVDDIITISRVATVVDSVVYDWVDMAAGVGGNSAVIQSADTKANLTTLMPNDGMLGYTTGGTKRFYVKIDSLMVCISHLE